jgi:DNA-binding Lrp family transcriptional regulator
LKLKMELDKIDKKILRAIGEKGGSLSTSEFSKMLNIPARTIRYRINKMKENNLIREPMIQTYERKMGMGERFLILQSYPDKEEMLSKILDEISIFYYYAPTYGRYEGFVVYAMYPLVTPHLIPQIADELKVLEIVQDYFIFDLVDYTRQKVDISTLLGDKSWSWEQWSAQVEKVMESGCELDLALDESPPQVPFDFEDVKIITHMVENPSAPLKEVAEHTSLSLAQVHKRVKRLEDVGILRENKKCMSPFDDSMAITIIFHSREKAKNILCAFSKLPFEMTFGIESNTRYLVTVSLPSSEVNQFLQRVRFLKKDTQEFLVQVMLHGVSKGYIHLLESYNENKASWELPQTDSVERIRAIAK